MYRCSNYSVGLPDNIMQHLGMQEELDVIVLLEDLVCFNLPEVLILCAKEKHWDIHWLVFRWVRPHN